jgi:hypothetical protein
MVGEYIRILRTLLQGGANPYLSSSKLDIVQFVTSQYQELETLWKPHYPSEIEDIIFVHRSLHHEIIARSQVESTQVEEIREEESEDPRMQASGIWIGSSMSLWKIVSPINYFNTNVYESLLQFIGATSPTDEEIDKRKNRMSPIGLLHQPESRKQGSQTCR